MRNNFLKDKKAIVLSVLVVIMFIITTTGASALDGNIKIKIKEEREENLIYQNMKLFKNNEYPCSYIEILSYFRNNLDFDIESDFLLILENLKENINKINIEGLNKPLLIVLEKNIDNVINEFNELYPIDENNKFINIASEFEDYWEYYGRAKGYWAGYLPNFLDFQNQDPSPTEDFGDLSWRGFNYGDWYEAAALYIWGDHDMGVYSQFFVFNILIIVLDILVFLILGSIFGIPGIIRYEAHLLLVSTVLYGIGLPLTLGWLYLNIRTLMIFLYGVNAFYQLLDHGDININLRVVNATGFPIDDCEVYANSVEAYQKDIDNPEWDGWDQDLKPYWRWNYSEFTYSMPNTDHDINDLDSKGYYSIHGRRMSERDHKAVPPPGSYDITITLPEEWDGPDAGTNIVTDVGPIGVQQTYTKIVVLDVYIPVEE